MENSESGPGAIPGKEIIMMSADEVVDRFSVIASDMGQINISEILPPMRTIEILKKFRPKEEKEIFITIEYKDKSKNIHGFVEVNDTMRKVMDKLFQDRKENMSIHLFEWPDSFLVKFADGLYIGGVFAKTSKHEVEKYVLGATP